MENQTTTLSELTDKVVENVTGEPTQQTQPIISDEPVPSSEGSTPTISNEPTPFVDELDEPTQPITPSDEPTDERPNKKRKRNESYDQDLDTLVDELCDCILVFIKSINKFSVKHIPKSEIDQVFALYMMLSSQLSCNLPSDFQTILTDMKKLVSGPIENEEALQNFKKLLLKCDKDLTRSGRSG